MLSGDNSLIIVVCRYRTKTTACNDVNTERSYTGAAVSSIIDEEEISTELTDVFCV